MSVVLDKAEAAWRLLEPVQPHHQPLNLATLAEQLVDLLLGRVEGQVPDVEGRRVGEGVFGRWAVAVFVFVVASAFVLRRLASRGVGRETHSTGKVCAGPVQPVDGAADAGAHGDWLFAGCCSVDDEGKLWLRREVGRFKVVRCVSCTLRDGVGV